MSHFMPTLVEADGGPGWCGCARATKMVLCLHMGVRWFGLLHACRYSAMAWERLGKQQHWRLAMDAGGSREGTTAPSLCCHSHPVLLAHAVSADAILPIKWTLARFSEKNFHFDWVSLTDSISFLLCFLFKCRPLHPVSSMLKIANNLLHDIPLSSSMAFLLSDAHSKFLSCETAHCSGAPHFLLFLVTCEELSLRIQENSRERWQTPQAAHFRAGGNGY